MISFFPNEHSQRKFIHVFQLLSFYTQTGARYEQSKHLDWMFSLLNGRGFGILFCTVFLLKNMIFPLSPPVGPKTEPLGGAVGFMGFAEVCDFG
ncbi:hypothetical protein ACN42_g5498 [Penicillium freii]|uniref:Uncharacterized protein n=1 Tax=Penicillium freii TaxID=48697 RepID=A0A117NNZ7_PENFR|nr:hypothetical protein ACN42_g5498 [Penicillium freii]